jgi:hypothetical protein
MKTKTKVQAGGFKWNHNGVAVKTKVRAGGIRWNHNCTVR